MWNTFCSVANSFISGLGSVLSVILSVLPDSPFTFIDNSPIKGYLSNINYFIPLDFMVSSGEIWCTAISVVYLWQAILRWIKAIN